MKTRSVLLYHIILCIFMLSCTQDKHITIVTRENTSPRITFGAEKLATTLKKAGYTVDMSADTTALQAKGKTIHIRENKNIDLKKEGFRIVSEANVMRIEGADASGGLYGAMEVVDRIKKTGAIDFKLDFSDAPEMVLRGSCIGLQKPTYLPGRTVYEYPYTPETFPWFYDKELWIEYLDMMVENRMNSLYLWNGHPFASLVKLKDYPYAVEVDEETFRKNEEIFKFLTKEANKRGIWVIQMFYNIIVSKPFAEHHNIKTQDRQRPITPLIADYTRKSIAAFIEKYPNVGLLVALGEAMSGKETDVRWFTETVIPGVKDGLKALGRTDEPPIILRAHDTDAPLVMEHALPLYKNLYTTHKYNGESLTTYEPRGPWSEIHKKLSKAGSVHISNVHILANVEPFRYGSPDFIQKSVKAMHRVHGADALHLYPQASYWDWPYTADKTEPRLLEMDRDWIWYKAWARYAWKSERDRQKEITFWSDLLAGKYGVGREDGKNILDAYEQSGEIAPKTLRRFGITEGNRQTLLLGMLGSQLVNPYKWKVYPGFYESCGPVGEKLIDYAEKEWKGEAHTGETPPQIIEEITTHGKLAVEAIEKVVPHVTEDKDEFERLRNDMHCYKAFADFFSEKVKAMMPVLRYQYSGEVSDLEKAVPHLKNSITHYRKLVDLTKGSYLYANSMQTAQRRIPIGGNDGKYKTWEEMLPLYERELANLERNIERLKSSKDGKLEKKAVNPWSPAKVEILNVGTTGFSVKHEQAFYKGVTIEAAAGELEKLQGIYIPKEKQIEEGTQLRFKNDRPVKVVVGYFNTDRKRFLLPPALETNAAGNLRGEAEVILANALKIKNMPRVNIHTYRFDPGENELKLGKGRVLILGFIDADENIISRNAGLMGENEKEAIDWVFY
ncbi:glycoside hydrolase family 20 zincin-like fold domain-containing protein [Sinomicrobium kalidii]|uniref:alpha-d-galacturonidase n=1 Tax=Sinomicrobium kalidii TaxID=2900738 RepID=UPI001E3358DC|nr:glycoside hydrolase family 20 zincin-like fold domain-containing protein [Sinomicrobium kalidii]UGU15771.1 glycoside hydrolase family 20 zincin-like fold domain-containing protein [Sinomicrobium kalidii]